MKGKKIPAMEYQNLLALTTCMTKTKDMENDFILCTLFILMINIFTKIKGPDYENGIGPSL